MRVGQYIGYRTRTWFSRTVPSLNVLIFFFYFICRSIILVISKNLNLQKQTGLGARAVVVCPSSSKCEQVQECCRQIIQGRRHSGDPSGDPVSVNVAYGLGVQLERKNTVRSTLKSPYSLEFFILLPSNLFENLFLYDFSHSKILVNPCVVATNVRTV